MNGPQFNIFNKLKKMNMGEVALGEDGLPIDNNVESFYSNPEYPAHISGLDTNAFYKCNGKRMYFGSGTQSEYEEFLVHLSKISGYNSPEELNEIETPAYFLELIKFSRTEGTIGPVIANKLYKDFRDNFNIAGTYFESIEGGKKYWVHYQNWCAGLYIARESGAIMIV